jgi:ATP-binding cassette subfamily B protein
MGLHKTEKLPSDIWLFLLRYVRLYFWGLVTLAGIILAIGIVPAIDSFLIKGALDTAAELQGKNPEEIRSSMFVWIIAYPLFWESINIFWRLYDYTYLKTMTLIQERVAGDLFSYIQHHSNKFFQETLAGSIANRISEAARSVELVLAKALECLLRRFATVSGALVAMFSVDSIFGFLMLGWLFFFIALNIIFYKNITRYTEKFSRSRVTALGKIVDTIYNISAVRMFSRYDYEKRYIGKYLEDIKISSRNLQWFMFKLRYVQGVSCSILIGFMSYYLVSLYSQGLVTVGDFGMILSLSLAVADDIWNLTQEVGDFFEELGICNQALSLLEPHQIQDTGLAKDLKSKSGEIEFKNVTFKYLHNKNIFENTSIKIKDGSRVGLVGYSGSGKTTFVNLITRLFDIESGEILLDKVNINDYSLRSLNDNIAFIPQNPILFHRSIRDNIKYGKIDATDTEMYEAAKMASIHQDIEDMPDGYETICGEAGGRLSGGQRQRIIIARAILKNSKILILDEATSALDSMHERLIQQSLNILMRNKTVLVIAHRLSTLMQMDRILVFNKGQIIEDGTHEELLEKRGLYFELWNSQYAGFLMDSRVRNDKNYSDSFSN